MKFTSYTSPNNSKIEIDDTKGYYIPGDLRAKYKKMFKLAQRKKAKWDANLKISFSDKKDYYVLTAFYKDSPILTSYGIKNEKGRQDLETVIPDELNNMTNEKTPFVVDVLNPLNYAKYYVSTLADGTLDTGSTGALTTVSGLLNLKRSA